MLRVGAKSLWERRVCGSEESVGAKSLWERRVCGSEESQAVLGIIYGNPCLGLSIDSTTCQCDEALGELHIACRWGSELVSLVRDLHLEYPNKIIRDRDKPPNINYHPMHAITFLVAGVSDLQLHLLR
jgi:hypothetical protein